MLPGFVLALVAFLEQDPSATQQVHDIISESSAIQAPRAALKKILPAFALEGQIGDSLKAVLNLKTGVLYSRLYVNDSALFFFERAEALTSSHDEWHILNAEIYNYLGNVARSLSDGQKAMEYYNAGLALLRNSSDRESKLMESKLLGNIGGIYYDLKDYRKALDYAERGRDVALKNNLHEHFQMDYLLVGFAARAAGEYDKAIENNERALALMLTNKDSSYLAHTYYNLASLNQIKQRYNEASSLFDRAITFASLFNEHEVIVSCMIAKASILFDQNDFQHSLSLAKEAEELSRAHTFLPKVVEAMEIQYKDLKALKDFVAAVGLQDKYQPLKDSLYKVRTRESLDEIETRYETEKKEQMITRLEQDNKIKDLEATRNRQTRIGLIVVTILLLAVVTLYYNRFRIKRRAAEELNVKNTELQRANAFRDRLFAVISHDLKSPLSAFQTLTSSITANLHAIRPDQLKSFIEQLNSSTGDILDTLNNLLTWAVSQTGHLGFFPVTFPPGDAVNNVIRQLSSMISQKSLHISTNIPESATAYGDVNLVQIVLRNLLANAIKFSETGGDIVIRVSNRDNSTLFAVQDSGCGIAEEDLRKLFRAGEDTRGIGNSVEKGTGIGLLLCAELIERHKGRIWAESILGKGSTFYFLLPNG